MGFVKWYEENNNETWNDVKDSIGAIALIKLTIEYEMFCISKGLIARWDG